MLHVQKRPFCGRRRLVPARTGCILLAKMSHPRHSMPSQLSKGPDVEKVQAAKEMNSVLKHSPIFPCMNCPKRPAFGDITNAHKASLAVGKEVPKKASKRPAVPDIAENDELTLEKSMNEEASSSSALASCDIAMKYFSEDEEDDEEEIEGDNNDDDYDIPSLEKIVLAENPSFFEKAEMMPTEDVDQCRLSDPYVSSEYTKEIFVYIQQREEQFLLPDYMKNQPDITTGNRALLVDWMIYMQESLELSHDTLYLAVKLVDHYLAKETVMLEKLQLIACASVFLASKFEERKSPSLDDILYICDYAYRKQAVLSTEHSILKALNFDINIPTAYRLLRWFAKCSKLTTEMLMLARFICELTLQEYDFIQESVSRLAAGCILLVLKQKKRDWSLTLEYYSGYKEEELLPLIKRLISLLTRPHSDLFDSVHSKYSHPTFFEVAKIPCADWLELEKSLQS